MENELPKGISLEELTSEYMQNPEFVKEYIVLRETRAFNAAIEAALGALGKKQTDRVDVSNLHTWGQMKTPQEGWNAHLNYARKAIEERRK